MQFTNSLFDDSHILLDNKMVNKQIIQKIIDTFLGMIYFILQRFEHNHSTWNTLHFTIIR